MVRLFERRTAGDLLTIEDRPLAPTSRINVAAKLREMWT
jgi:hypothetical protein